MDIIDNGAMMDAWDARDGHFLTKMAILDLAKKSVYRVDEFRNKYILMYYYNLL